MNMHGLRSTPSPDIQTPVSTRETATAGIRAPAKITAPRLGRNQQPGAEKGPATDSVILAGTLSRPCQRTISLVLLRKPRPAHFPRSTAQALLSERRRLGAMSIRHS